MTQSQQVEALAARTGAECRTLHNKVGALADLATTDKTSIVKAVNELKALAGTGSADGITYGEYGYDNVKEALDSLLYKAPVINSFTNSVNTAEMGSTVDTVKLNWSVNKTPTTLTLDGAAITATSTSRDLSALGLTSSKTWTLKMTDERGATAQKTTTVNFLNGVYHGVSAVSEAGSIDSSFILGLTKTLASGKAKTFTVNAAAGQYIYYCVPSRFGTVTFNVGGFDGGFVKIATISFTNASGYAEDYDVYKSENASLGNTTVTCK